MATYTVEDPEQHFFLHGGGSLASLDELFAELQTMEGHVFNHHVNDAKHDFSSWVGGSIGDKLLAKNMTFARSKDDLLKLLFINLFR